MNKRRVLSIAVIAAFLAFCAMSLGNSITPYVTFAQAKEKPSVVQIKGELVSPKITALPEGGISFTLRDEAGQEAVVYYKGIRPDNMMEASSIVAIGAYRDGRFMADKLLTKCPSKYQGTNENTRKE